MKEQDPISLRRSKVLELLAQGYTNQREISQLLNVSEPGHHISSISELLINLFVGVFFTNPVVSFLLLLLYNTVASFS